MKTALCTSCEERRDCVMNNSIAQQELTEKAQQRVADLLWDIESLIDHAIDDLQPLPMPVLEIVSHLRAARSEVTCAKNLFEREM